MAKCNYVLFYGQLINNPQIIIKNDTLVKGQMVLRVIRRFFDGNKRLEYSFPPVISANQETIEMMTTLKKGDMCLVKGVLTTMNIRRPWICDCGYKNEPVGQTTFITPIFVEKIEGLSSLYPDTLDKEDVIKNEGYKSLMKHNEISNTVQIIGTVCKMQELYDDGKSASLNFQVAVNRRYRLVDGDPEICTDYPWIRLYGDEAREVSKVISINSTLFIDGSLYTKNIKKKDYCENCGKEHDIPELVSEIRPYSVEYLHNCNLPDREYTENVDYNDPGTL